MQWGYNSSQLHEAAWLQLETTKLRKELGVQSIWDTEQAVERTIIWYKNQAQGANALALCKNDIGDFESLTRKNND